MPDDRLIRILSRLAADEDAGEATRLCAVCAEITAMSGAGIMLLSGDQPQGSVCTTNDVSTRIEELQYMLGEGPCIDAHRQHTPVAEPDLAHPATTRWSEFARCAVDAGARAVFGFPVAIGDVHIGALEPVSRPPRPAHRRSTRRRPARGRCRSPLHPCDASRRRAWCARTRARIWRQLPVRRPSSGRHGGRAAGQPRCRRTASAARARVQQRSSRVRRRRRCRGTPVAVRRPRRSMKQSPLSPIGRGGAATYDLVRVLRSSRPLAWRLHDT